MDAKSHSAARIAELEAALSAAHKTIGALRDPSRHDSPEGGDPPMDAVPPRTESESQLRRNNEELHRLNKLKAEFISIAAHELRTPLTSVVGYIDLLAEGRFGNLPETLRRPMSSLQRNVHRLRRLVEEMLDVSRIEAGQVTLFRSPCDLRDIAANVVEELQPLATASEQSVAASLDTKVEIDADADKIHQVVSNLLGNAIRHTPQGGTIAVEVGLVPQESGAGTWARLLVRNEGAGIPTHLQTSIFEPFSVVHPAKHHTSAGPDSAGLGLYIARGLVDLHGGRIAVNSKEGDFTEFTVLLPRTAR